MPRIIVTPRQAAREAAQSRVDNRAWENRDVVRAEQQAIDLMLPDIHPRLINVDAYKYGIDATTDLGNIDIQYKKRSGAPSIDLISAGNFLGKRERIPADSVQRLNSWLSKKINEGAKLQDILDILESSRQLDIMKGGKLLNTEEYPTVASLTKNDNGTFSNPIAYNLQGIHELTKTEPLRDLGMGIKFNMKDNYPRSRSDTWESAFMTLNDPRILDEFDVTKQYFG